MSSNSSTRPMNGDCSHVPNPLHRPYRYNPPRSTNSSSSASFKGCCCCLFSLITFLFLVALAVILIIVLALKPKKPQFQLQQVQVQTIGITQTNNPQETLALAASVSASLSLTIRMVFTAQNPNKVGIKYSGTQFYVMYKGVPLGVANVPGFYQPAHSVRDIETSVGIDHVNLVQADAADLIKDASVNDRVELKITGDVGAKIRVLNFNSPKVKVSVDCTIVISPRSRALTYKQCGVDGVNV